MGIRQRKESRKAGAPGSRKKRGLKKKQSQRKGHVTAESIGQPDIKEAWDQTKSLTDNSRKLGIVLTVNSINVRGRKSVTAPAEETEVVRKLEERAACGEAPRPDHMAEGERRVLKKLMDKYGEEYAKMSRDLRLNSHQHTAQKLRRLCERYRREEAEIAAWTAAQSGDISKPPE